MEVENGANATIPTTTGTQLNVPSAGNGSATTTSPGSSASTSPITSTTNVPSEARSMAIGKYGLAWFALVLAVSLGLAGL